MKVAAGPQAWDNLSKRQASHLSSVCYERYTGMPHSRARSWPGMVHAVWVTRPEHGLLEWCRRDIRLRK